MTLPTITIIWLCAFFCERGWSVNLEIKMTMLNCPFCGSEAKLHPMPKGSTGYGTVSCSNKDCPCRSHFHPKQWNERHDAKNIPNAN